MVTKITVVSFIFRYQKHNKHRLVFYLNTLKLFHLSIIWLSLFVFFLLEFEASSVRCSISKQILSIIVHSFYMQFMELNFSFNIMLYVIFFIAFFLGWFVCCLVITKIIPFTFITHGLLIGLISSLSTSFHQFTKKFSVHKKCERIFEKYYLQSDFIEWYGGELWKRYNNLLQIWFHTF